MGVISVIIPLFNKEATIRKAIDSVLSQTYDQFEIIIVNDGSDDNSLSVVRSIPDARITVIEQPNAGVSAARNRGITEAHGEYVTFLDADDEWDNDFLETIVSLIDRYPLAKVYGTNYRLCDCHGNKYETTINGVDFKGEDNGMIDDYFGVAAISSPPVCSICIAMRRSDMLEIGGFPKGIKSGEDLLTWARLLVNGGLAYCLSAHSTYNLDEGYEYGSQPVRRQDPGDPVGKELKKLLRKNPDAKGLKAYISHWHKMRASVAIRFGERKETIKECIMALIYNPLNINVFPFVILSILPSRLRTAIIGMKKH